LDEPDESDEPAIKAKEINQRLVWSLLLCFLSFTSIHLWLRDTRIQEELATTCYAIRDINPNLGESPFWMWKVAGISIAFVIGIFSRWRMLEPVKKPQGRIETFNGIITGVQQVLVSYWAINGPIKLEHARRLLASSKNVEVSGNIWVS